MIKGLLKAGNHVLVFLVVLITSEKLAAQITISGARCVIPGITYQYVIKGNGEDSTSPVKVCVKGGTLISGGWCTPDSIRAINVFIVWKDTAFQQLTVRSPLGNPVLRVKPTAPFTGGKLTENSRVQRYDSAAKSHRFSCVDAKGGSCTPRYEYQWQQSEDGLTWTDISNATGRDLIFTGRPLVETYFRRMSKDSNANTAAYSDMGTLQVIK